jgi:ketosteroid isomerase-like protein
MKTLCNLTVLTACCLVFLVPGCTQTQPDTRAADEAALRAADVAFSKAVEAKQLDAALAFYADDAVVLMPNTPMMTAKETIRKSFSEMLAVPGLLMKWQVTKVEAARSGDFGYTIGTYEMTMNDAKGKPVTDHGKYATTWKKQADGNWKVVVDISNTDLPVTPPSK